MHLLGIDWVGINAGNGRRLLLSVAFVAVTVLVARILRVLIGLVLGRRDQAGIQTRFWTRQGVSLFAAIVLILGLLSIWFDDPTRLATALGLVSAGMAFALQQVVTSIAGYFVILRGSTFTLGDRISMGGVRGDVMHLGFIQTTIMEMGQPPGTGGAEPGMWVHSRQFTGRIVTVTNSKIFAEPVFNYTRDFPFIWEEMAIPIGFGADRTQAEAILLAAARRHAVRSDSLAADATQVLQQRFGIAPAELDPRVYYRITSNWLELTVRFIVRTHGIRNIKDAMSRDVVAGLGHAGIAVATTRLDIVGAAAAEARPTM